MDKKKGQTNSFAPMCLPVARLCENKKSAEVNETGTHPPRRTPRRHEGIIFLLSYTELTKYIS